ncbi:DUF6688 family protein [Pedobacter nototheniae]|uniref:DUF6688 domain-containing protein n=1 Tax=Pedobacter nototheniae TaxID=2488994 RepID=UPI0029315D86|nr:DUF6688 family protein [Pedobacter nototheniae]
MIFVYALLCLSAVICFTVFMFKKIKKDSSFPEIILAVVYVLSLGLFFIGLLTHKNDYYQAIDPIDGDCYILFGGKHIITLGFYFAAFNVSLLLVWTRGHKLPPLTKVLSLGFIFIGIILSIVVLLQLTKHDTSSIDGYDKSEHIFFFLFAPTLSLFISIILVVQVINSLSRN